MKLPLTKGGQKVQRQLSLRLQGVVLMASGGNPQALRDHVKSSQDFTFAPPLPRKGFLESTRRKPLVFRFPLFGHMTTPARSAPPPWLRENHRDALAVFFAMPCSKRDKRSSCTLRSLLQPRSPFRHNAAEFLQYITIISTGAFQDAK